MARMTLLAFAILLAFPAAAVADFADGMAAYKRFDFARALAEWQPLADGGDPIAQFHVGEMVRQSQGVAYDMAAAGVWYRKAAEQGHAEAQFQLARMYDTGYGVEKDPAASLHWLTQSAEGGHALAMHRLGTRHTTGDGVGADLVLAYKWLSLAAARGGEVNGFVAGAELRRLTSRMSEAEIADAKRLAGEWQPPMLPVAATIPAG